MARDTDAPRHSLLEGTEKLVPRNNKWIELNLNYVEK